MTRRSGSEQVCLLKFALPPAGRLRVLCFIVRYLGVPCPTNMSAPPPSVKYKTEWKESRTSSWAFLGFRRTNVERMLFVRMFPEPVVGGISIVTRSLDTRVRPHLRSPCRTPAARPNSTRAAGPRSAQPFTTAFAFRQDQDYL
jgi:hypothetical protein